jgi:flagellar hook-associated protein 1 FlgK
MTLSSAFNIINSAFAVNAAQSATISNNITNATTPGYSREIANVVDNPYGGADVASIMREANTALLDQVNSSTSESASQSAISAGLATLAQTVSDSATATSASGATQSGASPSAMLANLQSALSTYAADPSNESVGQAVVSAADDLASSLNNGAAAVQQVREQADAGIATSVASINSLLNQFTQVNATIVAGLQSGANISSAQDSEDSILTQLSQQVGISTTTNTNGSVSIYTDSGVALFQDTPRTLSFTPSATLTAGASGNSVMVDGIPITGGSAPMAVHSGALAGLTQLRDVVAPEYQAQLDQISGGLISAFAETDQTGGGATTLPGLFTFSGATGVPPLSQVTGLSGQIEVNPNVEPSQGGDIDLLRDGGISVGISSPAIATYTYNSTGSSGYSGRIQQLASAISSTQSFDPTAGLGASDSLSDYANNSVGWLQGQNQQASDAASYQSSVVSQATSALSNATGVNMDTEMTNMLNIENSYTTSAKLLTTVNAMFSAILSAVQ